MRVADWFRFLFGPSTSAAPRATLDEFLATRVQPGRHAYHAENLTIEFLRGALAGSSHCPRPGEWLRNWDRRPYLPADTVELRNRVYRAIVARLDLLLRQESERRTLDGRVRAESILASNGSRVDKFLDIAYRKVATPDEYGDERPAALDDEIRRFLQKLAEGHAELRPELNWLSGKGALYEQYQPISYALSQVLRVRFEAYHRDRKARMAAFDGDSLSRMTGVEFELYLADLLRSAGITDVSSTAVTGDQGGDLLFTYRSRRVVVQAKRYGGTVGNEAVQQALAARGFYGCDEAWVVTNSQFSRSANTLAKEVGVVLIDSGQLLDLAAFLSDHFADRL